MSQDTEHFFDDKGYDVWGYDRAGHYNRSNDRAPYQASPFPHCGNCDTQTCAQATL